MKMLEIDSHNALEYLHTRGWLDRQVRAKVEQFAGAAASRDYAKICDEVLAPTLVARLVNAGVSCEQAMQIALGGVKNPTLSIGRITIAGRTASTITLSAAQGQTASINAIDLVKTGHGWRISSLHSPLTATATAQK